jgi:chemotaxis signal transduction protein
MNVNDRARALREEFDRSFTEPHVQHAAPGTPALAIRVGTEGHRWILPLDAISTVTKKRKIATLPGGPPSQVGLSGIHGQLTVVYSLAALLNYSSSKSSKEEIQWLALVRGSDLSIALGFEALDGQVLLTEADLSAKIFRMPKKSGGPGGGDDEETPRPIIDLVPLLHSIAATAGGAKK